MDWIHCNDCYKQPYTVPNLSLVLTSCARIQCSDCSISNSCVNKDCKPCKSQNYKAVPLDESIPQAVEDYFQDPLDHLKRFLKVYEFQRNHRNHLKKYQMDKEKQLSSQTSQLMKTTADLQTQIQRQKNETRDAKEENLILKKKIQELENALATERRPLAKESTKNDKSNTIDYNKRTSQLIPSMGRLDDRPPTSWQQKLPYIPNRAVEPSRQSRRTPTQQPQPHKPRATQEFLNPDTPAYFPSYSTTPTDVNRVSNSGITKQRVSIFPTPSNKRVRQTTVITPSISKMLPVKEDARQQQRYGLSHNRVYAFMSEAARQALTPEI